MKKFLLPVFIAFAMVGCKETDEINLNDPQEIKLYAGVSQMVAETKGTIDAFEKDAVIGVYAMKEGVTDWTTPYFDNTGTKIGDAGAVVFTNKVYYPQDDKKVNFYAFYPAGTPTAGTSSTASTVAYTLTGQEDILWATAETGKLSEKADGALQFSHKLAKVNFKAIAGLGFTTGINVTKVTVKGTKTAATLNVETGVLTFTGTAIDITPTITAQAISGGTTTFGDVMVEPGASYTVTVTAGLFDYTTTAFTAPGAGKAQTITLTFLPTILNASASITGWENVADGGANLQK